jgi:starch synthase
MNIVIVASEVTPFSKTGGLADVAGALPKALAELGAKVSVFSPFYPSVAKINQLKLKSKELVLSIKVGEEMKPVRLYQIRQSEVDFYFIANDEYFNRPFLYGTPQGDYPDNGQRFIFFSKAVLASLVELNIKPDVIHCHDWQTALIPLYLKSSGEKYQSFAQTKTIFTIHNLGYQGLFSPETFQAIGIPDKYFSMQGIEFYGKVNFLKAGLVFADKLTTVSPTYAQEIQTKEFGFGLEGVLATRQKDLTGIINGIDYSIWNPAKDKFIKPNYDIKTLTSKPKVKAKLIQELKLNLSPAAPLISFIGRLALQKGIELVIAAIKTIFQTPNSESRIPNFIILGTGEAKYHKMLKDLKSQYSKQLSVTLDFNDPLAHRIYAGSDIFLMPSQYEPCGLGQMIAFKYGTIPIGFKTGGLADTIIDYSVNPQTGNGFLFDNYDSATFTAKLQKAISLYQTKNHWQELVKKAMELDFSWQTSAQKYLKLYSN